MAGGIDQRQAWVAQLADGGEAGGQAVDAPDDPGLQRLGTLVSAFRQSQRSAQDSGSTPLPILFEWRHLKVIEQLGEGGFGIVYRAFDPMLRREVALKLARNRSSVRNPRATVAEARRQASLRHPAILAVHGADEENGEVGIWFDLLQGSTLEQALTEHGALSSGQAIQLALPLTEALILIHGKDMVHGDIKPANIMLQGDGAPVLMDFGAAIDASDRSQRAGSPLVMAPERFHGACDTASDMYSLGVVLYRCLTGRYPRHAESLEALEALHHRREPVSMRGVPLRWRRSLRALLAHDPGRRPDARELHRQVSAMANAGRRWRKRMLVATVIVALLLTALAGWWAYLSAEQSRQRTELVKDVVVDAVKDTLPIMQNGPVSIQSLFERLAENSEDRLTAYPGAQASLRLVVGSGLAELGDVDEGLQIAETAMRQLLAVSPNDWYGQSEGWLLLGATRARAGRNAEAEAAIHNALAALTHLDANAEKTIRGRLNARNQLAILLGDQGHWREEVQAQRDLLVDRQRLYGENDVVVAVDHHNLSMALSQIGAADAAVDESSKAIDLLRRDGDQGSIRLGYALFGLSMAQMLRGNIKEAQDALDQTRRIYAGNLPPTHRSFSSLDILQARIYMQAGEFEAAVDLLQPIPARPGLGDERQLNSERYLAEALLRAERWSEAETAVQSVLAHITDRQTPLRPFFEVADTYCRYRQGEVEKPLPALQAAHDFMRDAGLERMPLFDLLTGWIAGPSAADQLSNPSMKM